MTRKRFLRRNIAALSIVLLTLAGCGLSEDSGGNDNGDGAKSQKDDTLTVAVAVEISSIDPHAGNLLNVFLNYGNVTETLVTMAANEPEIEPALATSWKNVDDNTWRFELRDGVKFTNGEDFNAEAVKFSAERLLDPETGSSVSGFFGSVDHVEVVDDHTVDFVTKFPDAELGRELSFLAIVPPGATQAGPIEEPIGTGPFVFESKTTDELRFKANPDWWGGEVPFKELVVISRPDEASRIAALQAGEADIVWDVPVSRVDDVPQVISAHTREIVGLMLNSTAGITMDPRVRRAVNIGVDYQKIRTSLLGDKFSTAPKCQWVPEGVFGYDDTLEDPPYDPDEAAKLLDEAGAVGKPFTIINRAGYPASVEFTEAIALELEKLGLDVDLQTLDYQTWQDTLLGKRGGHTVESIIVGIGSDYGSLIQPLQSGFSTSTPLNTFPHADYPDVQPLLEKAQGTLDDAERQRILSEISHQVCEADSQIFLYGYDTIWGARDGVSWEPRQDNRIQFTTVKFD